MAQVETGAFETASRDFIKQAMKMPLLELDYEQELARKWIEDRDEAALHILVRAHMRLVVAMAAKFRNYGLAMSDLIQEGNIGLMQAAERFDRERGVRFSTYAGWWIRASIQDFVLRNWSIVRTGTTAAQKSLFFNLRRLRARINDGGNHMTEEARDYVVKQLGVRKEDVTLMEARLSGSDRSLNAPLSDGDDGSSVEWQDLLICEREQPEANVAGRLDTQKCTSALLAALQTLSPRELTIIRSRRIEDDTRTLEDLGNELGLSKERVRQIEHEALGKLRDILLARQDGLALRQTVMAAE